MTQADHYLTRAEDAHVWTQFAAHHQGRNPAEHADTMLEEFRKRFPPGEPPLYSSTNVDNVEETASNLAHLADLRASVEKELATRSNSTPPDTTERARRRKAAVQSDPEVEKIDSQWPPAPAADLPVIA